MQSIQDQFLDHIKDNPTDMLSRLVYADWLEENNYQSKSWRSPICFDAFGILAITAYGDGNGYGDADGNGNGNGYDYGDADGNGNGNGNSYDYGCGDGYGYGDGDGYVYGDADADGKLIEGNKMTAEVGKKQALFLPYGWVICGYVEEETGHGTYRVTDASVICRTGGTPWVELFNGQGRDGATFQKWGTINVAVFMSHDWIGDLP